MVDNKHNEIMFTLGELRSDVKGINSRLDALNGKTAETVKRVDNLEATRDEQRGGWKLFAMLGGASALGGTATALLSKIMK